MSREGFIRADQISDHIKSKYPDVSVSKDLISQISRKAHDRTFGKGVSDVFQLKEFGKAWEEKGGTFTLVYGRDLGQTGPEEDKMMGIILVVPFAHLIVEAYGDLFCADGTHGIAHYGWRRDNDPTHPVLDLMNLTDMSVKEAAADDCRVFNTSWFDEDTMIPELTKIAAADLDEYVVDKIIDHRPTGENRNIPLSKYYFLVKWEEFTEPTWEPYSGVKNLEPLDLYGDEHPGLKIPKSSLE